MDRQPPSATRYRTILGMEAVALAVAAFALSYAFVNVPGVLFSYRPTMWIIAVLLIWFAVAWAARKAMVGKIGGLSVTGRPMITWTLLRVGLLLSVGILLAGWLVAIATGWSLAAVLLRATALLAVISFVVGIAGGATVNSMLAIRRKWPRGVLV